MIDVLVIVLKLLYVPRQYIDVEAASDTYIKYFLYIITIKGDANNEEINAIINLYIITLPMARNFGVVVAIPVNFIIDMLNPYAIKKLKAIPIIAINLTKKIMSSFRRHAIKNQMITKQ